MVVALPKNTVAEMLQANAKLSRPSPLMSPMPSTSGALLKSGGSTIRKPFATAWSNVGSPYGSGPNST